MSNSPNVAGTWAGTLEFKDRQTSNLRLELTQDAEGKIEGTASSMPPLCKFTLLVTGTISQKGQWSVQSQDDGKTLTLGGKLGKEGTTISGFGNLGKDTGCGPLKGVKFDIQRQP
jgi:hypothetical protein